MNIKVETHAIKCRKPHCSMHLLVIAAAYIKLLCYASNLFSSAEMHKKIIKRDCYQIFILIPSKSFWIGKVVTLISLSLCHKVTRDLLLQLRCCLNTNHNLNIDHLIHNLCPFSIVTPRNTIFSFNEIMDSYSDINIHSLTN